MKRASIYAAVDAERARQDAHWGEQNHPDVDPELTGRGPEASAEHPSRGGCLPSRMAEEYEIPTAARAKTLCDLAARRGQCTWAHIATEELAELVEAATLAQQGLGPEDDVDTELVQAIAVLVAWREARARRAAR